MTRPVLLIVDDEPDVLEVLAAFAGLALPSVEIITAASGPEALTALRDRTVDAILCDYRMPELDGIEVLQRSVALAPGAKRVLMTAFADSSLPGRAAACVQLDGFIEKAMDPTALRRQLTRLMGDATAPAASVASV